MLFYVALITFSIFGRGIVNGVRKWLTSWKRLNVFWGRSDAGLLLARSIVTTTDDDEVFFMLQQKSGDGDEWRTLTRDIDDMKGMWSFTYDSNAVETDVSKDTLSQAKGRRHFFMDESGHVNVSRADRIVKLLRDHPPKTGITGFWQALCAGMILRWWNDCFVQWWRACRKYWKNMNHDGEEQLSAANGWWKKSRDWWRFCIDRWKKDDFKWDKPFLYVRIESPSDEFTYQTWASNVRDVVTPVLVRESQLIAKDFIKRYPLLKMAKVFGKINRDSALVNINGDAGGDIKILLIGFGAAGQDILNEVVCNGQFVKSYANGQSVPVHLHVDIVEKDEKVIEEYCIRRPLATRHPAFSALREPEYKGKGREKEFYDIHFIGESSEVSGGGARGKKNVRVEDQSFDDWFRGCLGNKQNPYDRIIVCLNGDEKTLAISRKVVEFARRQGVELGPDVVFARVKDPSRNRYLPKGKISSIFSREAADQPSEITLFGDLKDIYSFDRINVEVVDTMAKILNSRHNAGNNRFYRDLADEKTREEKWDKASFFDQLSSRAAAEGQRNLLLLRGMDYMANVDPKDIEREVSYDEVDDQLSDVSPESLLWTMAVNEHLRWNAFHLMMGFRPWDILGRKDDDDPRTDIPAVYRNKKIKANQLESIGKHADLVPFETLPKIDRLISAWKEGKTEDELDLKNFEGLASECAQAYDIAFCQLIGKVAKAAKQKIVKLKPPETEK